MKVLGKIPTRPAAGPRFGAQRAGDLEAFGRLIERLDGVSAIQVSGGGERLEAAVGLATTATARGLRVILVEADMSRPALADALGLALAPGLSEFLVGRAEVAELLSPTILAGPGAAEAGEPLVCVTAGRPVIDALPLLGSERFRWTVRGMGAAYDLVVVAGPPLTDEAAVMTIATSTDATLGICSRRKVPRRLRRHLDGVVVPTP